MTGPGLGLILGESAEAEFKAQYPSLHRHLKPLEEPLRKRQDQGRYWWELRSCAYWDAFEKPKIMYQEIQFHPSYSLDAAGRFGNNKTFFLSTDDRVLAGGPELAADVVAQLAVSRRT